MDRRFLQFLQIFFLVLDLFILNVIYLFTQQYITEPANTNFMSGNTFYWFVLNVFWIATTWIGEIYAYRKISTFRRFTKTTFHIYFVWSFLVLVFSFFLRDFFPLARVFVYATLLWFAGGLLFNRLIFFAVQIWAREKSELNRRIIILGHNKLAKRLAAYLESEELNVRIVGFVDEAKKITELSTYPVFSGISNSLKIANKQRATEIYSTIMPENNSSVYNIMRQADQNLLRFRLVPDFTFFIDRPVHVDYLYDMPVLSVRKEPLQEVMNNFKKRAFDLIVSLGVTVFILSWLIPLLGIIIYLQSPGPIFFVQLRSGKNNKPFRCYKFRSMTVNKEANSTQATRNDARVTKIGRIMRKTSLDEFPQFLNVLFGQMSIVGPRPHMLKHTKLFQSQEDQYMIRQFLKPGITGWAQVNGYRGEISQLKHIQKRVEYDLWYLENWSLLLDLKIIFLTVYNVFKGEENAF
ncbi:undecaprenyl-phosphate glucose phosphotransferase [Hymenobacter sp. HDW8]|uniref:undecaprenyl-phosphate glucose phosphotransferase n=1 Tax=Hymenobacter sp. HDW8 TaxID=2714932 RepID=UPI00140C8106|nr:undecaprenyl-phosphate glucose phosphotransferase [Hymenobacter sp. HDW8]QIL77327.1 undecaprenyl-phosphate glucose phosphotransferase [Hymenobacter sp. HDW8]